MAINVAVHAFNNFTPIVGDLVSFATFANDSFSENMSHLTPIPSQ